MRMRTQRLGGRGASTLEYALLMPAVFTVFLVCIEFGWQLAVGAALDYGAQRAARLGTVGSAVANGATAPDGARKSAIRAIVLNSTAGVLQDTRLGEIATKNYAGFGAAGGKGADGPGAGSQVVQYQLSYVQPFVTGSLAETIMGRPSITHTSTVILANEPFPEAPK